MIADRMDRNALRETVSALRSYVDERAEISEEFLVDPVGSNGLAILTRPLATQRDLGFVLCRSPGPEQGPLHRFEALTARELAARGLPTIRIRRGFGREGQPSDLSLEESAAEVGDAIASLQRETDVASVGVAGTLLGAAVALTVGARLELRSAAVVCPETSGPAYLRELYRRQLVLGFMTEDDRKARREPFEKRLERGPAIVRGVRLTPETFAELEALDLAALAAAYIGDALVVSASRSGEPHESMRRVAAAFARPASLEVVKDPLPRPVGEMYLREVNAGAAVDTRRDLDLGLARTVATWAAGVAGAAEPG
jgi:hypothetical protein